MVLVPLFVTKRYEINIANVTTHNLEVADHKKKNQIGLSTAFYTVDPSPQGQSVDMAIF